MPERLARTDPRSSDALIARARVYQRQGDFRLAFADYDDASRLSPSPKDRCLRGILFEPTRSRQAGRRVLPPLAGRRIRFAGRAEQPGLQLASDLAGWRMPRLVCGGRLKADDTLQAPHHNLVLVFLQLAYEGKVIPSEAFVHARRALEIGPESGELYRDLATLYALAGKQDAALAQAAIGHIAKAVDFGIDTKDLQVRPGFLGSATRPSLP